MTTLEQLRGVSAEVERACGLLAAPAPEALDVCSTALESAATRLASLQSVLPALAGDAELFAEAWQLQRDVRRAEALLAGAAAWHSRWRDILSVRTAGYRAGGGAAENKPPGRLCLTG